MSFTCIHMLANLIVGALSIKGVCVCVWAPLINDVLHHEQIFYNIYIQVCNIYIKCIAFIKNNSFLFVTVFYKYMYMLGQIVFALLLL